MKAHGTARAHIRYVIRIMYEGIIAHENSFDPLANSGHGEYKKDLETCCADAVGGDVPAGELIAMFSYWGNDIQTCSAHFGLTLERDENNKLFIRTDIPPCPNDLTHYWYEGAWLEAETPDPDEMEHKP